MSFLDTAFKFLPQVQAPAQKKLDLATKLKWTLIVLVTFFTLKHIPLFGLATSALAQFQTLSILLGAEFGSLISLGIGPIVTASIILQLLNGAGILKFNTTTHEGKARFQGTSKLLSYAFIIFEAAIFVFMGGLSPAQELLGTSTYFILQLVLIFQLILGGFMIMLLDDLVSKWGLTSGISLFIAAGVSESIFVQAFSPLANPNDTAGYMVGAFPRIVQALGQQDLQTVLLAVSAILATLVIFGFVVFFQSMKVEIPLSFGRVRGFGIRWPLNFLYTSVIPVTLMAALLANLQIMTTLAQTKGWFTFTILGQSLPYWFQTPRLLPQILSSGTLMIGWTSYIHAAWYIALLAIGALVFSWFWMQTSGMDAHSVGKQIMASGLQIPGFRSDPRIIEHILNRYIPPLTVMGGITIGLLSAFADVLGSLTTGTGILLAVMIVYKIYEDVAKQHMSDMNPMMKQFMGKNN